MRRIAHQEIGGGYATGAKIIIDSCELEPGVFETMAINTNTDEELDVKSATNEEQALSDFAEILNKHLQPLQSAVFSANMQPGKRYTIFCLSDFGYPVARKITFYGVDCATYAQHGDVVKIRYKPFHGRKEMIWYFYNKSFAIYDGWQDLPEDTGFDTIHKSAGVTIKKSRYSCFEAGFFEDSVGLFKNPLCIYKDYKTGVNGKLYA